MLMRTFSHLNVSVLGFHTEFYPVVVKYYLCSRVAVHVQLWSEVYISYHGHECPFNIGAFKDFFEVFLF